MRKDDGCFARLAPRLPPRLPACAAIILTILIFERMSLRTSSLLLLVGTTNAPFFFLFFFFVAPLIDILVEESHRLPLKDSDDTTALCLTPAFLEPRIGVYGRLDAPEFKNIFLDHACLCDAYRATGSLIGVLRDLPRD